MAADRRKEARELPGVSDELQDLIDALPSEQRHLNRVFWRDIAGYAIENGKRLDRAYKVIHKMFLWIAAATVLIVMLLAATGVSTIVLLAKNNDTLVQVQEGRHVSLGVTCATLSAVAQAGRVVIENSAAAPSPGQERALERLGFPPVKVRQQQARKEAGQYVGFISRAVDKQIGRKGDGLVQPDGTIDCVKLGKLAHIGGANLAAGARHR